MDPIALSTVLGAVSPILLAVLVQSSWSARAKSIFVTVACLALGLEVAYASGQLHAPQSPADVVTLLADMSDVVVASQAVYLALKKMGVIDGIESRTNVPQIPRIHVTVGDPAPGSVENPSQPQAVPVVPDKPAQATLVVPDATAAASQAVPLSGSAAGAPVDPSTVATAVVSQQDVTVTGAMA